MISVSENNSQQICSQSKDRTTLVNLELLDKDFVTVDTLEGKTIGGNISLTNEGFSRISGSLDMVLDKDLSTDYFKIDLNHLVRVIFKIIDNITSISAEYSIGICLLNSPTISRTANGDSKLSIELSDIFFNFNGTFGGSLQNTVTIPSGTLLSSVIFSIATDTTLMNLTSDKVKIESNSFEVPSDITCEKGNSISDLLQSLMDLYMGYELFFDKDGILTYQKIKSYKTDSPIQNIINSPMVISYAPKNSFENVKNYIKIWGDTPESGDETTPIQYSAYAELTDVNHPLSIPNIGKRSKTIVDENCQSTQSCQNQANFWLEKYSNYAETIQLELIPDYRLIPNRVIVVEYEDDYMTIENARYLINTVSFDLSFSGTSTINVSKQYNANA